MSYISEHIIPGNHGKTFESNIEEDGKFEQLKKELSVLSNIASIEMDNSKFPKEVKIITNGPIEIKSIQEVAKKINVHLIPHNNIFSI